ncbi:MAG: hypothetical protein QNJ75_03025 [Acidimicrobiia bacterium]|nr:hypothetical protein [Acidimicrobiia bacterium]
MSDLVLVGPFWTRSEAASYLGISAEALCERTDVVRIEGRWLEETYPALQFEDHEVRHEVSTIVEAVGRELPGAAIADWLSRCNPLLAAMTPLEWFDAGLSLQTALTAIHEDAEAVRSRVNGHGRMRSAAG